MGKSTNTDRTILEEMQALSERIDQLELLIEKRMRLDLFRVFLGKEFEAKVGVVIPAVLDDGTWCKDCEIATGSELTVSGLEFYRKSVMDKAGEEGYDYTRCFVVNVSNGFEEEIRFFDLAIPMRVFISHVVKGDFRFLRVSEKGSSVEVVD